MTGFASITTAINATKKGAFKYLTKPFEPEELYNVIQSAFVKLGVSETIKPSVKKFSSKKIQLEKLGEDDEFCGMIGRSLAMKSVFQTIKKVASSDSTILINGASGTGKELVANAIHKLSSCSNGNMVSVNCASIPSELLESEFFGHEKGSFTGAISDRKGRFELANNGTIFLDEIGDMPLLLQVKLLRVLQNKTIEK